MDLKNISDCNLVSGFFRYAVKLLFLISFVFTSFNAQLYLSGGVQVVGKDQIHYSAIKKVSKKNTALIYITDDTLVSNIEEYAVVKHVRVLKPTRKIISEKGSNEKIRVAVKEKKSQQTEVVHEKKNTIHYNPINNPETFLGSKHQYKTFNLPTEHPSKVLQHETAMALLQRDFSLEKTKILTAEFYNAHTFNPVFFTRPPPFKV